MTDHFAIVEKRTGEEGFEDFFVALFDSSEQAQEFAAEKKLDPIRYKIKKWSV